MVFGRFWKRGLSVRGTNFWPPGHNGHNVIAVIWMSFARHFLSCQPVCLAMSSQLMTFHVRTKIVFWPICNDIDLWLKVFNVVVKIVQTPHLDKSHIYDIYLYSRYMSTRSVSYWILFSDTSDLNVAAYKLPLRLLSVLAVILINAQTVPIRGIFCKDIYIC